MGQSTKAQSKPKISQYYGTGAVVAIVVSGVIGYYGFQYKTPVNQLKEAPAHQPKETPAHKFKMD